MKEKKNLKRPSKNALNFVFFFCINITQKSSSHIATNNNSYEIDLKILRIIKKIFFKSVGKVILLFLYTNNFFFFFFLLGFQRFENFFMRLQTQLILFYSKYKKKK